MLLFGRGDDPTGCVLNKYLAYMSMAQFTFSFGMLLVFHGFQLPGHKTAFNISKCGV